MLLFLPVLKYSFRVEVNGQALYDQQDLEILIQHLPQLQSHDVRLSRCVCACERHYNLPKQYRTSHAKLRRRYHNQLRLGVGLLQQARTQNFKIDQKTDKSQDR